MKNIFLICAFILIFTSCSQQKNNVPTGFEDYYFGMTIDQIYEKQPFLRIVDEINVDDNYIDPGVNGNQFYAITQFLYDKELVSGIKHPAITLQKNITVYLGDKWPGLFIQDKKLIGIGYARDGEVLQELIDVYGEGFLYGEQKVWSDNGRLIVWLKMEYNSVEMIFYFDERWVRETTKEIMKKHRKARSP
jgi:hypothetical protein